MSQDSTNDELYSTNDELHSTNDELHSTNDELHSTKSENSSDENQIDSLEFQEKLKVQDKLDNGELQDKLDNPNSVPNEPLVTSTTETLASPMETLASPMETLASPMETLTSPTENPSNVVVSEKVVLTKYEKTKQKFDEISAAYDEIKTDYFAIKKQYQDKRKIFLKSKKEFEKIQMEWKKAQAIKRKKDRASSLAKRKTYLYRFIKGRSAYSMWAYQRLIEREFGRRKDWKLVKDRARKFLHYSNVEEDSRIECRIPGYFDIYNKGKLADYLLKYQDIHVPLTYHIRNKKFVKGRKPSRGPVKPQDIWFLKPLLKCRGNGIKVSKNPYSLLKRIGNGPFIVQKGVENLMLIDGRKFDMRVWVVFVSKPKHPLEAYLFHDGVLRITVGKFHEKGSKLSDHLTNYAYQRNFKHYTKENCVEALSNLPRYKEILENLLSTLKIITPDIAKHLRPQTKKPAYFLAGFDFIVDDDAKPWLLEINFNPGISCINSHCNIYKYAIPDLIDGIIIPMIDKKAEPKLGGWKKIL